MRTKRHFDGELDRLRERLLVMAGLVESMLDSCLQAMRGEPFELLEENFPRERELNQMQRDLIEVVVLLIARHQPVADDLRFLVSALQIINNLERMGDLCINLGRKVQDLLEGESGSLLESLKDMLRSTQEMVSRVVDAFVQKDSQLAEQVIRADDTVDLARDQMMRQVLGLLPGESRQNCLLVEAMLAARNIERIADQATNVAEDIIFLAEGRDSRHQLGESHEKPGSWQEIRRIPVGS